MDKCQWRQTQLRTSLNAQEEGGSLGAGAWVQCKFQAKQRREQHLPLSHSREWSNCWLLVLLYGSKTCLCLLLNLNPGHNHWELELDSEIIWRCKTDNRQSQRKKSDPVLYLVDLLPTGSTMTQLKLVWAQQAQDFRPQFSGTSDSALASRPVIQKGHWYSRKANIRISELHSCFSRLWCFSKKCPQMLRSHPAFF